MEKDKQVEDKGQFDETLKVDAGMAYSMTIRAEEEFDERVRALALHLAVQLGYPGESGDATVKRAVAFRVFLTSDALL